LAARNAHKAFLYALALCDAEVIWLWPEKTDSVCACPITAEQVEEALRNAETVPAAVYVTSPDYLGNELPIKEIAEVCHKYGTLLLVDNAHGAYLRFLPVDRHPITLGADLCCDSAHKTLPVLTGGAYLHIGKKTPEIFAREGKQALALFGSTSPSYLTLASLDLCNLYLEEKIQEDLRRLLPAISKTKETLMQKGWEVTGTEPMKITIRCAGTEVADRLRKHNIECEYADRDFLVLMPSAQTAKEDLGWLVEAIGENTCSTNAGMPELSRPDKAISPRQAIFAPWEYVSIKDAEGHIAAAPTVGCPPAVPIVVSGERIDKKAAELLAYYGFHRVAVVAE
jgi:arginine/lysine/ornithine decarboxylase